MKNNIFNFDNIFRDVRAEPGSVHGIGELGSGWEGQSGTEFCSGIRKAGIIRLGRAGQNRVLFIDSESQDLIQENRTEPGSAECKQNRFR